MTKSSRLIRASSFAAVLLGLAATVSGCVIGDCKNEDGTTRDNCISLEPATKWNHGDAVTQSIPYTSGMSIDVQGVNGKITMKVGGAGNVEVRFDRFTFAAGDDEAGAKKEMETKLELSAAVDGNNHIVVKSKKLDGATAGLGADITVTVPAGYDGGIDVSNDNGSTDIDLRGVKLDYTTVRNDNGSLDLLGAGGQLTVGIDNGVSANIQVEHWSVETSLVDVDVLDLTFTVGAGLGGSIQATSQSGTIADPDPLPSDWTPSEQNADNSKSYSFGDGSGGTYTVNNTGDIVFAVGGG